ncbi:MAG: Nramp family divalent metal transporter [Pirellulales bacterium]|nr:Nramp family divalent metal transporter [Pirellulales bacterium]
MAETPQNSQKSRSLEEVHRSVRIPTVWWRRMFAFAGPAYLVSVGYMDPGNWATDIEGGATFGYRLIWVLLMSNLMAVLLQTLSARLGLVTGRDLAQACHDDYPRPINYVLFVLCEIAIAACDLAEVLGSAIGLKLLSHAVFAAFGLQGEIPLLWGVLITGFDVLLLLLIQKAGIRKLEAFILMLVATIGACFLVEIFLCKPDIGQIAAGFVPRPFMPGELYVAIGILGATVMPHNLYLHSALVQSRDVTRSREAVAQACRFNLIDSAVAMNAAFFVNAAILIVAAATFWTRNLPVTEIEEAHSLLELTLGSSLAPIAFALALLCSGQSSTITGTLAGQITMEGFLQFRIKPWVRRLITRLLAIVPAVCVIFWMGEKGVYKLLILSQVVLSLQLSFAIVPLVRFTGSKQKMGPFVNRLWVQLLAWIATAIIVSLNVKLVFEEIMGWIDTAGDWRWLVIVVVAPLSLGLLGLLAWMTFRREKPMAKTPEISAGQVVAKAAELQRHFKRIGVALEATTADSTMLAEALALARQHRAELVLMHVVDGVGGTWYGDQTGDRESRDDEAYLRALTERLRAEFPTSEIPAIDSVLGYGNASAELVGIARREKLDLVVMGGHGHRGISDLLFGQTISGVRHGLKIPIIAVRGTKDK